MLYRDFSRMFLSEWAQVPLFLEVIVLYMSHIAFNIRITVKATCISRGDVELNQRRRKDHYAMRTFITYHDSLAASKASATSPPVPPATAT